ncbi:MAG: hypothetical protein PHY02_07630 [Phycisphaerae bacterium]|nr:hypothetical protein [Phycisphaerae bacterium]
MLKKRLFLVAFAMLIFCPFQTWARDASDSERYFSPSLGQKFYEIAYELANPVPSDKDINGPEVEQAVTFLNATLELDNRANYVYPLLIKLVAQHPSGQDYSDMVQKVLARYLDESADFEPARQAVQYLLERLDSREQREQLLTDLLQNLGGKNDRFDSELATLLGLLLTEKADTNTAQSVFIQALNSNKYNKLAFAQLAEIMPEQISPAMYLEHFRLALSENPLDLETALAFARYAEQIQLYQTAADAYKHCAELFSYLYPSQLLPPYIYLPWMLSNYNTPRNQHDCLQIASQLRQNGQFDLLAEAIAAKAAAKIGNTEQANQIFQTAEQKINNQPSLIDNQSIAWFYCFAYPDVNKALDWANKAYSTEPNSPTAAALLAYSLVMNEQIDWTKPLIENYEHNQIADLTLALIQLTQGEKDSAIENLKLAIDIDPGSLEAGYARQILSRNGGEYIPSIDPDITLTALRGTFGEAIVPAFVKPDEIISARLNFRGSEFSYGVGFDSTVAITNNSSEPLVISDDGLFTGYLRVDANITGDLNKYIPNLASLKIRPASPIKPGSSLFVPLHLQTAELWQMLFTYPQASVNIEFTLYLDPVTTGDGRVISHIPDLKPTTAVVKRSGIDITGRYLRNRLTTLTKGQQGQKIKTAQLFVGLLMEQYAMAGREPFYKFIYADWMPPLLKSALVYNLASDDWVAKVNAMTDMTSMPLDYEFTSALAENLNDTHWPIRLMTMYLLAKNPNSNFTKVLDWTAKYDSNTLVRDMAIALGGTPPPPPDQDQSAQPTQTSTQQQSAQQQQPLSQRLTD